MNLILEVMNDGFALIKYRSSKNVSAYSCEVYPTADVANCVANAGIFYLKDVDHRFRRVFG